MPASTAKPLTAGTFAKATPKEAPYELRSTSVRGLVLRVQPTGTRSFYVQVGRDQRVRIGDARLLTLGMAEHKARELLVGGPEAVQAKRTARTTLGTFVEEVYGPLLRARSRGAPSILRRMESVFADWWSLPIGEINVSRVETWRASQAATGKAPATINRNTTSIKAVLAHAVRVGVLTVHPLAGKLAALPVPQGTPRYLGKDEHTRLVSALPGAPAYLRVLVTVAMETGCRQGELFGLQWKDVRLDESLLVFLGTNTKTARTRYVPLSPAAHASLKQWRPEEVSGNAYVWPGREGRPIDNVRKSWATLLRRAAIAGFDFKDLRSSAASHMVMNGAPLLAVSKVLGHTTTRITELHYAGLAPAALHDAISRVAPR
ncbi:MAG: tyrosine-type recombinase/integrase [Burkholderiaceae bacterium]